MSLNAHDSIVLVAPRPVRLAAPVPFSQFHSTIIQRPQPKTTTIRFVSSPAEAFEKLKLGDDVQDDDLKADFALPPERSDAPASPRASPRSTLPSEALEEFLSILRPSSFLFPPTSPILRPSNHATHGFVPYRRSPSCRLSPSMSNDGLGMSIFDQPDNGSKENDLVSYPFKILGTGALGSPVSRAHTRNPFPRQASLDTPVSAYITEHSDAQSSMVVYSPNPSATLSPAAVPLPSPTPDEMEMEYSSS